MERATEGRVWTPLPNELKESLQAAPVPTAGVTHAQLRDRLVALMPHGVGNTHPRFFGWVHGSGNPGNVLAEIAAAAMNANCGGRDHAAIYIERQVVEWCRVIMGFPTGSSGLVVSGTSTATVVALKVARDAALGATAVRSGGVAASQQRGGALVGYCAQGAHSCVRQAFDLLGLGTKQLRQVACHTDFTMDLAALEKMVEADRRAGFCPFLVVGTAGSVNVGAIDDLSGLAEFARVHSMWLHVDGAFGATAVLSDEVRPRLAGMERADSLAFDFHKWLHVNYDAGCVLVRDRDAHLAAFSDRPDYLAANVRGLAANNPWPVDFGIELSRGFRALKVWAHLLEHGTAKLGAAITTNVEQARFLARLVDAAPELTRLAPATLNIVVFRYVPASARTAVASVGVSNGLDALNEAIVVELQESGVAVPSTTKIHGAVAIRCCLTNHRTTMADLEILVKAVRRVGAGLEGVHSKL